MVRDIAGGAIFSVARRGLALHWRMLVALGVLAGCVGGPVVGALVLARRTDTAYPRLARAMHIEDVRVQVRDRADVQAVRQLPGVRTTWTGELSIGQVVGGNNVVYAGVLSGSTPVLGLSRPVVVDGRAPAPGAVDEVLLNEDYARRLHWGPGKTFRLAMLTPEEAQQFDTGFGAPDGPTLTFTVTGIGRAPATGATSAPIIGTPAFSRAYGDALAAVPIVFVRLDRGAASIPAFKTALARLSQADTNGSAADGDFAAFSVNYPSEETERLDVASRVLVSGLLVFASVSLLAGIVLCTLAFARHHAAGATTQRIEWVVGMTRVERTLARVLPASLAALLAAGLTLFGGIVAGRFEPLGALRRNEPSPGWSPNWALVVAGAALAFLIVLVIAAATAFRAGARRRTTSIASSRRMTVVPTRDPTTAAGLDLALGRGRAMRATIAAIALGLTLVVAAAAFTAGLDRLTSSPSRYGWPGDAAVIDPKPETMHSLVDDSRFAAVGLVGSSTVDVGADPVIAYSLETRKGTMAWTVLKGRMPRARGEVLVGSRLARHLDVSPGDHLVAGPGARPVSLRVVGIGIGPVFENESLGRSIVLTRSDLDALGASSTFFNAIVRVRTADPARVVRGLEQRYEVERAEPPPEVVNLDDLSRLPEAVALLVGAVALGALALGTAGTLRARSRDIAVLRALGLTPRQAQRAVLVAGLVVGFAGTVVGVAAGLLAGRVLWSQVAQWTGVAADGAIPVRALVVLGPVVVALAAMLAVLTGRHSIRQRPARLLTAE